MADALRISIITDPQECKSAWDACSPNKTLFDVWEYRYAFYTQFLFPLHFVAAFKGERVCGLLPLWHQTDQDRYLWFGDTGDDFHWQEDAVFWAENDEIIQLLLENAPTPLEISSLRMEAVERLPASHRTRTRPMNSKAVLPLHAFENVEDFITALPKKVRSNLRRDVRQLEKKGIEVVVDDQKNFDELIRMNAERFPDSPFHDQRMVNVFRSLMTTSPLEVHLFAARLDGQAVAVDYVFLWNDIMYPMVCGADVARAPGIGQYMNVVDIREALARNMHTVDFAETEEPSIKTKLFPIVPQFIYEH